MKITVFRKMRKTMEGRTFASYLTRLPKKDGSSLTVSVRFKNDSVPDDFPAVLEVSKKDANLSERVYTTSSGEDRVGYTLWVNAWALSGEEWIDHSLDDFED